jgi:hypothetical protein
MKINQNALTEKQYLAQVLARDIHGEVKHEVYDNCRIAYNQQGELVGGGVWVPQAYRAEVFVGYWHN